jgi:hypothetical protein
MLLVQKCSKKRKLFAERERRKTTNKEKMSSGSISKFLLSKIPSKKKDVP